MNMEDTIECTHNGKEVTLRISETGFEVTSARENGNADTTIPFCNILKLNWSCSGDTCQCEVHHVVKQQDYIWKVAQHVFLCDINQDEMKKWDAKTHALWETAKKHRPKSLLVFLNPKSGYQKTGTTVTVFEESVRPLFDLAGVDIDVIVTTGPNHVSEVIATYDLSKIDGIVVSSGDGTVHHALTAYYRRFAADHNLDVDDPCCDVPRLPLKFGHIPTGTYNGLAQRATNVKDVSTSALHIILGETFDINAMSLVTSSGFHCLVTVLIMTGFLGNFLSNSEWVRWMGKLGKQMFGIFKTWWDNDFDMKMELEYKDKTGTWHKAEKEIRGLNMMASIIPVQPTPNASVFRWLDDHIGLSYAGRELPTKRILNFIGFFGNPQLTPESAQHIAYKEVTEVKIKIDEQRDISRQYMGIDGEAYPLTDRELHVRMHRNIISLYGAGFEEHTVHN